MNRIGPDVWVPYFSFDDLSRLLCVNREYNRYFGYHMEKMKRTVLRICTNLTSNNWKLLRRFGCSHHEKYWWQHGAQGHGYLVESILLANLPNVKLRNHFGVSYILSNEYCISMDYERSWLRFKIDCKPQIDVFKNDHLIYFPILMLFRLGYYYKGYSIENNITDEMKEIISDANDSFKTIFREKILPLCDLRIMCCVSKKLAHYIKWKYPDYKQQMRVSQTTYICDKVVEYAKTQDAQKLAKIRKLGSEHEWSEMTKCEYCKYPCLYADGFLCGKCNGFIACDECILAVKQCPECNLFVCNQCMRACNCCDRYSLCNDCIDECAICDAWVCPNHGACEKCTKQ